MSCPSRKNMPSLRNWQVTKSCISHSFSSRVLGKREWRSQDQACNAHSSKLSRSCNPRAPQNHAFNISRSISPEILRARCLASGSGSYRMTLALRTAQRSHDLKFHSIEKSYHISFTFSRPRAISSPLLGKREWRFQDEACFVYSTKVSRSCSLTASQNRTLTVSHS